MDFKTWATKLEYLLLLVVLGVVFVKVRVNLFFYWRHF